MYQKLSSFITLLLLFLNFPQVALAETIETGLGVDINSDASGSIEKNEVINAIIRVAIGAAGGIAFLLIIYGGFKLAFSRGDPQAIQDARDVITSAIVGMVLVVLSVFLLNLIGVDILGLPI